MLHPRITLKTVPGEGAILRMHPDLLRRMGAPHLARGHLCFGQARREVAVLRDSKLGDREVAMGSELAEALGVPEDLPWEIKAEGGEITLGPFIGILRFATTDEFNMQTLMLLKDRTLSYAQLRGIVFAFAADQLGREDGLVDGYYYHPDDDGFRQATLPLPASVFRHVPLAPSARDALVDKVGGGVFNDYHPDKWEVYRWLVGDADLAPHLPLSRWFRSWEEIEEMVGDSGQALIRPISEADSGSSVLLQRRAEGWSWRHRVHREWVIEADTDESVKAAVSEHLGGKPCLVHQWPFPLRKGERWVDYHVRVQKGQTMCWSVTAVVGRRSGISGPVANISAGGMATEAEPALVQGYNLDEPALYLLKQRLFDLAIKVGERLDACGVHLGDIAVDIGFDIDRKLWIHNVNARIPDPTIALDAGNRVMYYKLTHEPLFYAKALAGFPFP